MKKSIILIFVILVGSLSAKDIVTLKNNKHFAGSVLSVQDSHVEFRVDKTIYNIPLVDIQSITLEDTSHQAYADLLDLTGDYEPCLLGQLDAEMYHGKKGVHFLLGALFGPFTMIGTALCEPTPEKGKDTYALSQNQSYFSDPLYLSCYKKKARSQMLTFDALGWATWIALLLI